MPKLHKAEWFVVILAIVYVLSPADIIPEMVAGPIGLTDDVGALAVLATTLWHARRRAPVPAPETEDNPRR